MQSEDFGHSTMLSGPVGLGVGGLHLCGNRAISLRKCAYSAVGPNGG